MSSQGINKIARVTRMQKIPRIVRLVRLLRLAKMASVRYNCGAWLRRFEGKRVVQFINFMSSLLWTLHVVACFWYLCAALQDDPMETWVGRREVDRDGTSLLSQSPFEQWLVSMYFVLTVITTVGFGDISAVTEAEILYVGFVMVFGAMVHGIIISKVISIVTSSDQINEFIQNSHNLIDAFSDHTMLAEGTRRRMKDEVTWRTKSNATSQRLFDREEMAGMIMGKVLPWALQAEMSTGVFGGALSKNDFLRCCRTVCYVPPRLPLLLACCLSRIHFDSGEVIYQLHDFPFNLFLVLHGTCAYIARPTARGGVDEMHSLKPGQELDVQNDLQRSTSLAARFKAFMAERSLSMSSRASTFVSELYPYRLFSKHNYFGDFELFQGCPRQATARCEKAGDLLVLHKADLNRLEEQFPQFHSAWATAALQRERFREQARLKLRYGLSVRHLAALHIQLHFRALRRRRQSGWAQASSMSTQRPATANLFEAVLQECAVQSRGDALRADAGPKGCSSDCCLQAEKLRLSLEALKSDVNQRMDSMQADFRAFRHEVLNALRARPLSI